MMWKYFKEHEFNNIFRDEIKSFKTEYEYLEVGTVGRQQQQQQQGGLRSLNLYSDIAISIMSKPP